MVENTLSKIKIKNERILGWKSKCKKHTFPNW